MFHFHVKTFQCDSHLNCTAPQQLPPLVTIGYHWLMGFYVRGLVDSPDNGELGYSTLTTSLQNVRPALEFLRIS